VSAALIGAGLVLGNVVNSRMPGYARVSIVALFVPTVGASPTISGP